MFLPPMPRDMLREIQGSSQIVGSWEECFGMKSCNLHNPFSEALRPIYASELLGRHALVDG
jgi:hypothetical protein